MKLTLQLQLLPTDVQADTLLDTMHRFNEAATEAARIGFDAKVFSQSNIQKLCYQQLRQKFGLSAQMAVRAIGKAVDCFRRDKTICPAFRLYGAMTYDERILSFKDRNQVSILTVGTGRQMISYVFGEYQKANLGRIKGQCDLVHRNGKFFLLCTIDLPENMPIQVKAFLGVDLGIVNIATDSEGEQHTGKHVEQNRKRQNKARQTYQRTNTRAARRRLRKLAGRQARFQRDTNHRISKAIVAKALVRGEGIALEDLKGIRSRCEPTVSKRHRQQLGNWGFFQLRQFVCYKAKLAGVPVTTVNPRNTSRTCYECGHCKKGNRQSQDRFSCLACGHNNHADHNAARNIGRLGAQSIALIKQRVQHN